MRGEGGGGVQNPGNRYIVIFGWVISVIILSCFGTETLIRKIKFEKQCTHILKMSIGPLTLFNISMYVGYLFEF